MAVAIDAGITRHTVFEKRIAPLFRVGLDGSGMRNNPTSAGAICSANGALVP